MDARSSVAAFLFHPNLRGLGSHQRQRVQGGTLENNAAVSTIVNWMPRQRVPGGELGDVQSGSAALRNIVSWMRRRGLAPHDGEAFFFDHTDGFAYTVDMVCEMEGKLTLVLIYVSERRGGEHWSQALSWAQDMLHACRRTLNLLPRVFVLNVYGEGCRVRGGELDDTEDERALKFT
jgi:hypothetical protein